MPTRKIADPPQPPCSDPDHEPAMFRVYEPGVYVHTCAGCGESRTFMARRPTWKSDMTDVVLWKMRLKEATQ